MTEYLTLKDLAEPVKEYLVPLIQEAVERCLQSYRVDVDYNDTWTFGTQLWRNTWNRVRELVRFSDGPFTIHGKDNEYKLKIGPFVLRLHRVDRGTQIPKGAKAAKQAARHVQMALLDGEWILPEVKDNIVVAIDADVQDGLREIFVGELVPQPKENRKYQWATKLSVFLADGYEQNSDEFVPFEEIFGGGTIVPEEQIPDVHLGLSTSKIKEELQKYRAMNVSN